ncbi:MAG: hypothetical protein K2Y30_03235 [Flavobacteriaceae bacterium]|nr:hypothetical protein [Flavobacteriaceae bacterium]
MEKYLEYSRSVIEQLNEKYKNCEFHFRLTRLNVDISVFFVLSDSSALSEKSIWESISKDIALKYQSKLESIYEKWNLYIIYISTDTAPKELKNKIENDKFSSRKIVEDTYDKDFNDEEANRLIVQHITNSDLKEIVDLTKEVIISQYIPVNESISKLLENQDKVSGDREAQSKLIKAIATL